MFVTTLDLEDLSENKILIKLPRNKLFKVNNFYLISDWATDNSGHKNTLSIYVDEEDKTKANVDIRFFIDFLNFMYNIDLTISTSIYISKLSKPLRNVVHLEDVTNRNIKNINDVFSQVIHTKNKEDVIFPCLHYFSRSLKLAELELFEEAFLTVYKPIELISKRIFKDSFQKDFDHKFAQVLPNLIKELFSEEYQKGGGDRALNDSITKKLDELITTRRKIKCACNFYNFETSKCDNIGKIVQLRNKVGAHSSSGKEIKIGINEYIECMKLSKALISAFILDKQSNSTYLDVERQI